LLYNTHKSTLQCLCAPACMSHAIFLLFLICNQWPVDAIWLKQQILLQRDRDA